MPFGHRLTGHVSGPSTMKRSRFRKDFGVGCNYSFLPGNNMCEQADLLGSSKGEGTQP